LFDIEYILIKEHVKFVTYKLKRKSSGVVESVTNHPYVTRQTTYKNVETDKMTLTSPQPYFRGRKDGDLSPTVHEIVSIE